jgi:hypothetical protein
VLTFATKETFLKLLTFVAVPVFVLAAVSAAHASAPAGVALQTTSTATPTASPTATPSPSPTPTATATPTATLTPPSGKILLAAAETALGQKNTFHEDARIKLNFAFLVTGTIRVTGDVALKQRASFTHITGTLSALGKAQKQNEYDIQIKKQLWVKSAKTHNTWQKAKPGTTASSVATSSDPLSLKSATVKISGLKVTGSSTVGDVSVWQVQGTVTDKSDPKQVLKGKITLLIAQDTNLPYELDETINDTKDGIQLSGKIAFSNFGEKLSIKAPKVGSTTP